MIRKIQTLLIRIIAAGRPVMMNVHMKDMHVTILGDKASVQNCQFYRTQVDVIPSSMPRFSVLDDAFMEPPQ